MRFFSCAIALCALAGSLTGQNPSASVVGHVTDPAGAVIPGASIGVTSLDTNISQRATSNEAGEFTVPYLKPGRYSLEASAAGFRVHRRPEFSLLVDQALRLDIPLEIGAVNESVTVTEAPPAINTDSSARGAINTSLGRRIRFHETRSPQLRLEAFNFPNRPNFNLPENRVDIISGRTISRVRNNRTLQLGARMEF